MKAAVIIMFACLLAVAFARPDHNAQIVKQISDVGPESYSYAYETDDGTKKDEDGHLADVGTEHEAIVVKGSYQWKDEKTGEVFNVVYVADENGFQPHGAHIPSNQS